MYGLRGCNTIEVPVANQRWPLASGRWLRIEGGNSLPSTSEKFTPPCSKTRPPFITRERPPPPSGRTQLSSAKSPSPSNSARPEQMES